MVDVWIRFLRQNDDERLNQLLRGTRTGRPVDNDGFMSISLELLTERICMHRIRLTTIE